MTKKIVRDHDMLGLQGVESLRLRDIADLPLYPFLYPRFDCDYIPVTVKQFHHLRLPTFVQKYQYLSIVEQRVGTCRIYQIPPPT